MAIIGPRQWSGNQQVVQSLFVLTNAFAQYLPYNPDRVSWLIGCSSSGATLWIAFKGGLAVPNGIPLSSTMPPLLLDFSTDGDLVKQPLWAVSPGGVGNLYVVETLWLPGV